MSRKIGRRDGISRASLFLMTWATFSFTLFTLSSTKFHHYIYPAIPACAVIIGITVSQLLSNKSPDDDKPQRGVSWILWLLCLGTFAAISSPSPT